MRSFIEEISGIYRLRIPFESVYTSVFLIMTEQGNALIDCATYASDIDDNIVPALNKLGLSLSDIKYLIITHYHGDHAGGKTRILELVPNIKIIQTECSISLNGLTMYELKGHTLDCIGVFDERSSTLISGDGLQGYGVDKYRCTLESRDEYLKTIEKIEKDEQIKNILFSHAYEPWYKDCAFGREQVLKCLKDCRNYIKGD